MNPQHAVHFVLRTVAAAMLVVYGLWNLFWLVHARVPPSLFLGLTGLPGPTTGGTRSLFCLLRGDWRGSLAYNAMTVPILGLLVFCMACLAFQLIRRQRPRLPHWTPWVWLGVLGVAWVIKLTGSPAYW
jgi:hypothetical protein